MSSNEEVSPKVGDVYAWENDRTHVFYITGLYRLNDADYCEVETEYTEPMSETSTVSRVWDSSVISRDWYKVGYSWNDYIFYRKLHGWG